MLTPSPIEVAPAVASSVASELVSEVAPIQTEPATLKLTASPAQDEAQLTQLWLEMSACLGLKAYAGQLARQSELTLMTDSAMVLRCETFSLATDEGALKALRAALKTYFTAQGKPVPTLKVEIAELGQVRNSPQKTSAKQRDDSLACAKQAVQQHPTIAAIVREFDGMILPNSIQPE